MTPEKELTRRQREILGEIARGRSNKEIARDLHIDENTVKSHVHAIFKTLGVRNRTEAALYFVWWLV